MYIVQFSCTIYILFVLLNWVQVKTIKKVRISRERRRTLDFNGAQESLVCFSFCGGFIVFFTGVCWWYCSSRWCGSKEAWLWEQFCSGKFPDFLFLFLVCFLIFFFESMMVKFWWKKFGFKLHFCCVVLELVGFAKFHLDVSCFTSEWFLYNFFCLSCV